MTSQHEQLLRMVREENSTAYSLSPDDNSRVVLVVGRTKAGISTLIELLKNPFYHPNQMSIYSNRENTKILSYTLQNCPNDKGDSGKLLILVDAPGFGEVVEVDKVPRAREAIIESTSQCVKHQLRRLNCLIIVFSVITGLSEDDISCISFLFNLYYHQNLSIAFAVTRCETKSKQERARISEQLRCHPVFSVWLSYDNVSLFFSGCIDSELVKHSSIDALKLVYEFEANSTDEILAWIDRSSNCVGWLDLPMAETMEKGLQDTITSAEKLLVALKRAAMDESNIPDLRQELLMHLSYIASKELLIDYTSLVKRRDRLVEQSKIFFENPEKQKLSDPNERKINDDTEIDSTMIEMSNSSKNAANHRSNQSQKNSQTRKEHCFIC